MAGLSSVQLLTIYIVVVEMSCWCSCLTLKTLAQFSRPLSVDFRQRQNMGCHFLQGISQIQGSNLQSLHFRQILYPQMRLQPGSPTHMSNQLLKYDRFACFSLMFSVFVKSETGFISSVYSETLENSWPVTVLATMFTFPPRKCGTLNQSPL